MQLFKPITTPTSNEQGNTNGNIHAGGYITEKDGWLYYCNISDRSFLYKVNIDGSQKKLLNNKMAYEINVVDDYIYYIHGSPGPIYKIHKEGGHSEKIESKDSSNLIVKGTNVFYRLEYRDLYKIDTNGNSKVKLKEGIVEFSIGDVPSILQTK